MWGSQVSLVEVSARRPRGFCEGVFIVEGIGMYSIGKTLFFVSLLIASVECGDATLLEMVPVPAIEVQLQVSRRSI